MEAGDLIVLHLVSPNEKYWGLLIRIGTPGVTFRGINLSSFDDWMNSLTYDEEPALGLATIFFPLHRVERLFLDEPIGQVESLAQAFARRVGMSVREYLDHSKVDSGATTH